MDKNQYSCTSEFGAEVLMVITSFIVVAIAMYYYHIGSRNRNNRLKLSDKDADIFLSMAHALFLPLMSYLFSQAKQNNSEERAQIILVWMVLTEFIWDRAFDSTWELKKSAEQLVRLVWVGFLVYGYESPDRLRTVLFILCAFSFIYEILKGISYNKCRDSYFMGKNPKLIHNYMNRVMLEDDLKTTPINSCDYIVMSEENHEIVVCEKGCVLGNKKANSEGKLTIARVFQLNSSEDEAFTLAHPDWRNNCLSLAMAKMLQRRIVNIPLDEAGNRKALEFVLDGLIEYIGNNKDIVTEGLSNRNKNPVERVFSIIRDELKFISDFSHFKVPTISYFYWCCYADYIGIFIAFYTFSYLPYEILRRNSKRPFFVVQESYIHCHIFIAFDTLDELITLLLAASCAYIHYKGSRVVLRTDRWSNLCYVQRSRRYFQIKRMLITKEFLCSNRDAKAKTIFDIKVNGRILALLAKWTRRNIGRVFPTVFISTDVKEAILRSLKTKLECGGQLTNGEAALQRHGILENLNLVYRPSGSATEAILVWHISTTLFHHQNLSPEPNNNPFFNKYRKVISALIRYKLIPGNLLCHEESSSQQNNDRFKKERAIALALSSYCHYLVAYLPDLLPDDVEWTEKLYESGRAEIFVIDRSSGQRHTRKNRCNYAMSVDTWGENSVVGKGVKVAQMLVVYADSGKEVWTMLSEFWAEMMLFIAPSDNVKGHEEILEKEELITQLWALLTHAGIVTRPKPTQPPNHRTKSIELTEVEIQPPNHGNESIELTEVEIQPRNHETESIEITEVEIQPCNHETESIELTEVEIQPPDPGTESIELTEVEIR
ncbi:hypothetical protein LUZ62_063701 [Rhynchospora pubera]|uniref:DUF4220 domain-containing protein n=1 Tax=Rhynchospora pubera TaxID=906938 RepID=A0AAV8EFF4_9POAL|nr:hypothetical protein LUZ62_063701 [Rhynchospora pubera]